MDANQVLRSAEQRSPDLVTLALLLSPAVRMEPELIRAVRLELIPKLPAGSEGELWFSSLVSTRGQDGIVLDAGVANLLRSRARAILLEVAPRQDDLPTQDAIRDAWQWIVQLHDAAPPALQLEEGVNWLAISEANPESAIEAQLQLAVEALRRGRTGVARWAARALPRMPDAARSTTAAWLLAQGAGRRLASREWETRTPDLARIDDLASLSSLNDDLLGIYRFGDRLDIGEVGRDGASIRVLDTNPRVLAASAPAWKDERVIQVRRGALVSVTVGSGPVLLRTPRGEIYRVEAEPGDVLPELRRSCVIVRSEEDEGKVASMGIAVAPGQVLTVLSPHETGAVMMIAAGVGAGVAGQVRTAAGPVALIQAEHLPEGVQPIRLLSARPAPPNVGDRWYGLTYGPGNAWSAIAGSIAEVRDGTLAVTTELSVERPVSGCPVVVDGVLVGLITSQTSTGSSFSVETSAVADLLGLGPKPDRVAALTSAAQAIALEFHMRFEGFRRASDTGLNTDALMARAGLTPDQLGYVRGAAEYIIKEGVEARTRPRWLLPSGPPRFSAAVMTALDEAGQALGSPGGRQRSLPLSGRRFSPTASAQRALTDIGVAFAPSAFGLNAELDSGKFAASGWRQLRTILGDDLPRLDDWDPWSAAPAAAADRPQALLEVLGALCRSDTRVPEPARTVLMYADAHLYPRWWQVRDDLVQAGTPDIGPEQEFPDFLEAYLGWCLTVLRQVGTSAGGYGYDMGFAIPRGDAEALPVARFGLDVHAAQPDADVRLEGRFSALVGFAAWVFLELADQVRLAAAQPPQYHAPPPR